MWPVVRETWPAFLRPFEGRVPWLYLDRHVDDEGKPDPLVSAGLGFLADPLSRALALPFTNPDGTPTSPADITNAWLVVKSHPELAPHGGGSKAFAALTTIRLTDAAIDEVTDRRLDEMEHGLLRWFPSFAEFPADAQRLILSMAWAMGPERFAEFPRFRRAANAQDWDAAGDESHIRNADPARNAINVELAKRAARVVRENRPRDQFLDPNEAPPSDDGGGGGSGAAAAFFLILTIGGALWLATRSA